jgi:hypothetical protein
MKDGRSRDQVPLLGPPACGRALGHLRFDLGVEHAPGRQISRFLPWAREFAENLWQTGIEPTPAEDQTRGITPEWSPSDFRKRAKNRKSLRRVS